MKITTDVKVDNRIYKSFEGIAVDKDGDLWLLTIEHAIFIDSKKSYVHDRYEADSKFGPFTKYFGKVTLENG